MKVNDRYTLKPITDDDISFLFQLYTTIKEHEIGFLPLPEEQKKHLLKMQFNAQEAQFKEHYSGALHSLIMQKNKSIGRVNVLHAKKETRIIDISLMPDFQNNGIGGTIIKEITEDAQERGVPTTLHVAKDNPARLLYLRHGFEIIEDRGMHFFMEKS